MAAQPAAQNFYQPQWAPAAAYDQPQWAPATAPQWAPAAASVYDCYAHSQSMGDMQSYAQSPAMVMGCCPAVAPYASHLGLGDQNTAAAAAGAQAYWYQQQPQMAVAHAVEIPQLVPEGQAVPEGQPVPDGRAIY